MVKINLKDNASKNRIEDDKIKDYFPKSPSAPFSKSQLHFHFDNRSKLYPLRKYRALPSISNPQNDSNVNNFDSKKSPQSRYDLSRGSLAPSLNAKVGHTGTRASKPTKRGRSNNRNKFIASTNNSRTIPDVTKNPSRNRESFGNGSVAHRESGRKGFTTTEGLGPLPASWGASNRPSGGLEEVVAAMYPSDDKDSKVAKSLAPFKKELWSSQFKAVRNIERRKRKAKWNCCTAGYILVARKVNNSWPLLLLWHLLLFIVLATYIVIGATVFTQVDEGKKYPRYSPDVNPRLVGLRSTEAERLLNISLEAILEDSRDAILDTIFTSDKLQAALTVFKSSRLSLLPADRELELLSDDVLKKWKIKLEEMVDKGNVLATIEARGYQLSNEEIAALFTQPERIYSKFVILNFWESCLHSFCLITTIGASIRSTSFSGQTASVLYTLLGLPLYLWVVKVWAQKCGTFINYTGKFMPCSRSKRKVASSFGVRVPSSHWKDEKSNGDKGETLGLLLAIVFTISFIIGIGPVVCITDYGSFGEGVEASFLVLLTVRPPHPLPQRTGHILCFIFFVMVGHFLGGAVILKIRKIINNWLDSLLLNEDN